MSPICSATVPPTPRTTTPSCSTCSTRAWADYTPGSTAVPAPVCRVLLPGCRPRDGSRTVAVPVGLPQDWPAEARAEQVLEEPQVTVRHLNAADSVVTGCASAIAETGTIVLDPGPGQGRRVLTLAVRPPHMRGPRSGAGRRLPAVGDAPVGPGASAVLDLGTLCHQRHRTRPGRRRPRTPHPWIAGHTERLVCSILLNDQYVTGFVQASWRQPWVIQSKDGQGYEE